MDFREVLTAWSDELGDLGQNHRLDESSFIRFAKERGLPVAGVITGDPKRFNELGWLPSDGTRPDGKPEYHPFRFYTLHKLLQVCRLPIAVSASLNRESIGAFIQDVVLKLMPQPELIGEWAAAWNRVVSFCVLIEPIYWPQVTGVLVRSGLTSEDEYRVRLERYRQLLDEFIASLNPGEWAKLHEELRTQAAIVDDNGDLYLFLRGARWDRRKRLGGDLSCALWIRHMAEMIRRAFQDVHEVEWPEEDIAFGWWSPGARRHAYGSDRPLDDVLDSLPHLGRYFGVTTGSTVRWYVEGDTEFHAVLTVIPDPARLGIELVNLRGNIAIERANIALKLSDALESDCASGRFSMLSFDLDVPENVKAVRRQVEQNRIVGYIAAHDPDFEFGNFTLGELIEIASNMDESLGFSGAQLRQADWTGVTNARLFERAYAQSSSRGRAALKGTEWGRHLAEYAVDHPNRKDNGEERPFWGEVRAAIQARTADYHWQREKFAFNPHSFALVEIAVEQVGE